MEFLKALQIGTTNPGVSTGTQWISSAGETIDSYSPVDGKKIASVTAADKEAYETVLKQAEEAFKVWRLVPAPTGNDRYLRFCRWSLQAITWVNHAQ